MTLITKKNSIYANYNGEVLDIYALEGSNGNKQIFYTQLTSDDIKNMIAGPSKEERLEERLTSDFNCDYNFEKPSKKHINQYPKTLLNSIKMAEMITPTKSIGKHTPGKHMLSKHTPSKETRRKKQKKRKKRRKTNSISKRKGSQNNTKRVKYTPFSKPRKTKRKYYLTPSSNDKMIELEKEDDRPSIERTVY